MVSSDEMMRLTAACEERIFNAWPAPSTMILGDWVLRFAHGYSGRANSASSCRAGADLDAASLAHLEQLYAQAGLPACVRVTPLAAAGLAERLQARGYHIRDASHGMVAPATPTGPEPALHIGTTPSEHWLREVCARQSGAKRNVDHLRAIVWGIRLPAAFALWVEEGAVKGTALCVADRGMAEIASVVIDESCRGRGLGRRMVQGLMGWAAHQGCLSAFLQVEIGNAPAIRLYERLGFVTAYSYQTWVRESR